MRRTIIGATLAVASVVAGGALVAELAAPGSAAGHKAAVSTYSASGTAGGSSSTSAPATDPIQNALKGLVSKGVITQAQADAVAQALHDALPGRGGFGEHGGFKGPRGRGFESLATVAKALGIDAASLRTQLEGGATIADIAKAHNIDPQKVIDALVADAKTHLDQAVSSGKLTQAQEDQFLKDAATKFANLINNKMPMFGPRRGRMFGPALPSGTPPTSNA